MTLLRKLSQAKIQEMLQLLGWLAVLFFTAVDSTYAAREVSEKRECATCHIMWLKEFKQNEITPLIPYDPKPVAKTGKQDVSSTERMCFSCHDGFVLDSRFMWKDKSHAHPVGVKPSRTMRIPTSKGKTIFPLNDDGKVYCGTCHTAHGVDWKDRISPIFLRVRNVDSSMCLACHLPKSEGPKKGNHPIFEKSQHGTVKLLLAGSRFSDDGSVICETCHRPHGAKYDNMLVKANRDSSLCQTCHKNKSQLIGSKHDISIMAPEVKNKQGKTARQSGPCGVCHEPHAGGGAILWARKIPVDTPDRAAATCLECHNSNGIAKEKSVGDHSHPIMRSLSAVGIKTSKKGWSSQHLLAKGKRTPQSLPLFNRHGERDPRKGKVSCATCHDPHSWSTLSTTGKVADKTELHRREGDGNSSFLRIAQGKRSALCLNCHLDQRALAGTPHDPALIRTAKKTTDADQAEEERSQTDEKLYNEGFCENCHQVHNAKGVNLRANDAGPGKLYTETWCRDCHREDGLAKDKAITGHSHPLGIEPKNLNTNSKLPLFTSDGAHTKTNGVVDCATCHDPHAWTPQAAISSSRNVLTVTNNESTNEEKPEGDALSSFLRMTAAGDAPLCSQCHSEQALVRGTDHDLRVTAAQSTNMQGQNIGQSGICGQCHAIHNSVMANELWAQNPGDAKDVKAQQCTSCHMDNGTAKGKVPPKLEHPDKVVAWSNESRNVYYKDKVLPVIPVYNKNGAVQRMGMITCTSCHNPHQWNPRVKKEGSGKNEEGDALSSFLRNNSSEYIVCADCHGKDALFRYKYFHGETSRKKHPLYR